MASPGSSSLLHRPRLAAALSTPTQLVALVGPIGAGATTLLRQWAAQHPPVTWGSAGSIPDAPGEALVIDDADDLSDADWGRVREAIEAEPRLLVRMSVRSRAAIPTTLQYEAVTDLRFTMRETAEYLSALDSHLDATGVHLATGGLPAAVRAVAQVNTTQRARVGEVLAALRPGSLAEEDAGLAIPEVLTQELVTALGGSSNFIDEAERAGRGEWTPDAGCPLFVLTAPVRAATLKAHPVDASSSVREQAARVLLGQGSWYGALVEGAASKSLPLIDAALKGGGMNLLRMRGAEIAASLRDIRPLEMRRWPIIALALGLIYNARHEHRLRAAELLGIALLGVRTAPAGTAERALLHVVESVARRLLGIGDGGVKAARAATRILGELPPEENGAIEGLLGDLHTHSAISLMYGGHAAEAVDQFERVLATSSRPGLQLIAFGGIAMIHALAGDLIAAQSWVDAALKRPWSESILNEYQGSLLRIAQAKIHVERGELPQADASIQSVWHIIDTIEHWPLLAHLRALSDMCAGRAEEGLERLRALRRRRGTRLTQTQARLLDSTESSLALAAGDMASARDLTPRAGDRPMVTIAAARVKLFDGADERALRMLGGVSADGPESRAHIAVLEAIALRRRGRDEDAASAARRARTITDAYGLTTPFLLIPAADRELFGAAVPWHAPALAAGTAVPRLTERELVILGELLETANVNDIATRLHVSVNTVKSQRRTLYRKLGANSRDEVLSIAFGHGLFRE